MEYLKAILIGSASSLIAYGIIQHYRQWCEILIRFAADRLPSERSEICKEEWLGNLGQCKSMFTAFALAFNCCVVTGRIMGVRAAVTSQQNVKSFISRRRSVAEARVIMMLAVFQSIPRSIGQALLAKIPHLLGLFATAFGMTILDRHTGVVRYAIERVLHFF